MELPNRGLCFDPADFVHEFGLHPVQGKINPVIHEILHERVAHRFRLLSTNDAPILQRPNPASCCQAGNEYRNQTMRMHSRQPHEA